MAKRAAIFQSRDNRFALIIGPHGSTTARSWATRRDEEDPDRPRL